MKFLTFTASRGRKGRPESTGAVPLADEECDGYPPLSTGGRASFYNLHGAESPQESSVQRLVGWCTRKADVMTAGQAATCAVGLILFSWCLFEQ